MLLYKSEVHTKEGRTPTDDTSRPSKGRKKVVTKAKVILSASTEEHGRPLPKPTSEVDLIPLDPGCPKRTVEIGKIKAMLNTKYSTTLRGTTYDVGGSPGRLHKRKACFIIAQRLYVRLAPQFCHLWMIDRLLVSFHDFLSSGLGAKRFRMRW